MSLLNLLEAGGAAFCWHGLGPKRSRGRAIRVIHSGGTFNEGRNAERRAARRDALRRMHMLANRRLRQLDSRRYG